MINLLSLFIFSTFPSPLPKKRKTENPFSGIEEELGGRGSVQKLEKTVVSLNVSLRRAFDQWSVKYFILENGLSILLTGNWIENSSSLIPPPLGPSPPPPPPQGKREIDGSELITDKSSPSRRIFRTNWIRSSVKDLIFKKKKKNL